MNGHDEKEEAHADEVTYWIAYAVGVVMGAALLLLGVLYVLRNL